MITVMQAVLLGVIQGLTEFLPVSSTGHLVIAQQLLKLTHEAVLFDSIVHLGSLVAVVMYFHSSLTALTKKQFLLLSLSTIPTVIAGVVLAPYVDLLFSSLKVVGFGLLVTASLLLVANKQPEQKQTLEKLTWKQALVIGLYQTIALIPGISRSGSTITGGMLSGLSRPEAFRFSLLLSIPTIIGASVYQLRDFEDIHALFSAPFIVGFLISLLTALFALRLLEQVIVSKRLHVFAYYCLTVGLGIIVLV